jgi:hypothetical protein
LARPLRGPSPPGYRPSLSVCWLWAAQGSGRNADKRRQTGDLAPSGRRVLFLARRDRSRLVEVLHRGPRLPVGQAVRSVVQCSDLRRPVRRRPRPHLVPRPPTERGTEPIPLRRPARTSGRAFAIPMGRRTERMCGRATPVQRNAAGDAMALAARTRSIHLQGNRTSIVKTARAVS